MLANIPLLPIWILAIPWLLGMVELIRTPRSNLGTANPSLRT